MASAAPAFRRRLACPRCAGDMVLPERAAGVHCPYCGSRWFAGAGGDAAWFLRPRLAPDEALASARRWLRGAGVRVLRVAPPAGVLLPFRWMRGSRLVWTLAPVPQFDSVWKEPPWCPRPDPGLEDVLEPRFAQRAYAHVLPVHPLSDVLSGRAGKVETQTVHLLDPDDLPGGFVLVPPDPERADAGPARWLQAWERRTLGVGEDLSAAVPARDRNDLLAIPAFVVTAGTRAGGRLALVVDAQTGRVVRAREGDAGAAVAAIGPAGAAGETMAEARSAALRERRRGPALVPLECRDCGWELSWDDRDRVFGCPHCGSAWEVLGSERRRVRQWLPDAPAGTASRWLPFWVFPTAKGRGDGRETGFPTRPWFVPAYEARHGEDQLHLAARLTRRPPDVAWRPADSGVRRGASVGSREAAAWRWALEGALARATLATFTQFLKAHCDRDPISRPVKPRPRGIAWIPFVRSGGDLAEVHTGAVVRENGTWPWARPRRAG